MGARIQFNWLDYVLIGFVATVAAVQFLRSTRSVSRILYEALLAVGAAAASVRLMRPLARLAGMSPAATLGSIGFLLLFIGFVIAALLDVYASFSMGFLNYLLGLFLALICAYALGHIALRTTDLAISPHNPKFAAAVRSSLVCQDLLCFGTLTELIAFLRFVRWKGV